jgi:hypothetical protein
MKYIKNINELNSSTYKNAFIKDKEKIDKISKDNRYKYKIISNRSKEFRDKFIKKSDEEIRKLLQNYNKSPNGNSIFGVGFSKNDSDFIIKWFKSEYISIIRCSSVVFFPQKENIIHSLKIRIKNKDLNYYKYLKLNKLEDDYYIISIIVNGRSPEYYLLDQLSEVKKLINDIKNIIS